ncbi:MAG TPA: hypothetical protein VHE83_15565 [Mycobacteriales bacterium]|nr:hypothetical protein [Mycobacteriales bacterium]
MLFTASGASATPRPTIAPACLLCLPTPSAAPTSAPGPGGTVDGAGGVLASTVSGAGTVVSSTVKGAGTAVASTVTGVGGTVDQLTGGAVSGPVDGLTGSVDGAVTGLTGTLGDTVSGVTGNLGGTVGGVTGTLGGTLSGAPPGQAPGTPAGTTRTGEEPATTGTVPDGTTTVSGLDLPGAQPATGGTVPAGAADALIPESARSLDLGAAASGTTSPALAGSSSQGALSHLDLSTPPLAVWVAVVAILLICAVGTGNLLALRTIAVRRASQAAHSTG